VAKDNVTALMWLHLSAAQGQGEAVRDLLARTMSAKDVEESQRRAEELNSRVAGVKTNAPGR